MKITSDLTNLKTAILVLTVQMFIEWTLHICRAVLGKFLLTKLMTELTTMRIFKNETSYDRT
jgi:hypothetical protein